MTRNATRGSNAEISVAAQFENKYREGTPVDSWVDQRVKTSTGSKAIGSIASEFSIFRACHSLKTSGVLSEWMRDLIRRSLIGCFLVSVLFACILQGALASSQHSISSAAREKLPADLPGVAHFIRDEKGVSIIEFAGDYDNGLYEPRKTIGKEFFREHADVYDFLVVYSSFKFPMGSGEGPAALAFHMGVRNDVNGIGVRKFDNSELFGSKGVLQSFVDMSAVGQWSSSMSSGDYDQMLNTFVHEVQHRWGSYVKFRDWNGKPSAALLGKDDSHWSYLLDTEGSVQYGARWRDNGDGSFTASETRSVYSPLDLYLSGLIDKSKVPPFTLIEASGIDAAALPPPVGTTIRGTKRVVTVDDIIAIEGPRVPAADVSQKSFRFAFIYLVRPGETIDPAQLDFVAQARRQVGLRFNALTHGAGMANVFAEPAHIASPGLPSTILPPDVPVPTNPGNNALGLTWLKSQQKSDGSFMDAAGLAPRDTLLARSYLRAADPVASGLGSATAWITGLSVSNTDFLARRLIESFANERRAEDVAALLEARNRDGGWGLGENLQSNPLDTALAVRALRLANGDERGIKPALDLLLLWQNADGGWGNAQTSPSRVSVSSQVLRALAGFENLNDIAVSLSKVKSFLKQRQNADGGLGDGSSSIHDTAHAALAMLDAGLSVYINLAAAQRFVADRQRVDGSWQGSVYSTVLALQLLRNASAANLAIGGLQATPFPIYDGQRATLSAKVVNAGVVPSQASTVRFFEGDPAAGGVAIGNAIPIAALVGGDSVTVNIAWNTTSRAGQRVVFAVVDFEQATLDLSRQDNSASLSLVIETANPLADVLLAEGDVVATPSSVSSLPADIQIDALISNAGMAGVSNAKAVLWAGTGAARIRVAETSFTIGARATAAAQFKTSLTVAGTTVYTVELDPEGLLSEESRDNNSGSVTVKTVGGVSLAVNKSEVALKPSIPRPGADVVFSVRLHNSGTLDSTSFNVRYSIRVGESTTPILTNVVQIAAGATVDQNIPWRAGRGGSYSFIVEMDPDNTSGDSNLTDNTAEVVFNVAESAGLNLAVSYRDLGFTPSPALEGVTVALGALVRNVGDVASTDFSVQFYDGDPDAGGSSIGATKVSAVAPGTSTTALVNWVVPTASERLIFVVVDPDRTQRDESSLEDNKAFASLRILTLPDFAISPGALSLTPRVPKPGDLTTLTVKVSNLGEQAASNIQVSAFHGSQSGGVKLAPDVFLPALASKATETVQIQFNAPSAPGLGSITVVVNPQFTINERVQDNNSATIGLGTQDANFSVSEAFISPDGDGVKDSTVLIYRLPASMPVSLQVRDDRGNEVRTVHVKASEPTGLWEWDGLDNDRRLVQDGQYELTVLNTDGVVLGGATVEVDTNRISLLAAIGTPAAIGAGLTCTLPSSVTTVASIRDGAGFYLSTPKASNPLTDLQAGIYREDEWGRGLRLVLGGVQNADSDIPSAWNSFVANEQGTRIVAYNRASQQLVSAGGEGESKKVIFNKYLDSLIGLSRDASEVFAVSAEEGVIAVNTQTGAKRSFELTSVNAILLSPDRQRLIAQDQNGDTVLLDLHTGNLQKLPAAYGYYWTPNGALLVGRQADSLLILDANGDVYRKINAVNQRGSEVWAEDSSAIYIPFAAECHVTEDTPAQCSNSVRRIDVISGVSTELQEFTQMIGHKGGSLAVDLIAIPGRYELLAYLYVHGIASRSISLGKSAAMISYPMDFGYRVIDIRGRKVISTVTFDESPWGVSQAGQDSPYSFSSWFIEHGRALQYRAYDAPSRQSSCVLDPAKRYSDAFALRTLENLQIDMVLARQADGTSVKIRGGVADKHFARYWLEYASDDAPEVWHPIIPASTTPVWGKDLALWVTPGVGRYTVRLTAEDLAGNQKQKLRRINIAEDGPPITNVVREPAYISPNGDGSSDEMTLRYRVLESVNLEFSIFNRQGALVRSISRSHPLGGVDAAIVWDGRDGNGQVVVDGEYRINVVGFDFFVTVDNSAPIINALKTKSPFSLCKSGPCRSTELRWSVSDINFDAVQIEVGEGNIPATWRPYQRAYKLANNLIGQSAIYLSLADYVGKRYRITAMDLAGNRTIAQFEPAQEAVKLILAGQIMNRDLQSDELPPSPDQSYLTSIAEYENLRPSAGIAMAFAETINEPVVAVAVQFNEEALAQNGQWQEQPNVQVYPIGVDQSVRYLVSGAGDSGAGSREDSTIERSALDEDSTISQNLGMVGFFNGNVSAYSVLHLRLKLTGKSGMEYITNTLKLKDGSDISVQGYVNNNEISGSVSLRTPRLVQRVEVFVSSVEDPYFAIERKIYSLELNRALPPMMVFFFSKEGRYVSCATYRVRAIATLENGQQITSIDNVEDCGGVKFRIRPNFASCEKAAPHQLHGYVTPIPGKNGAAPLSALEVYAQYSNGVRQLIHNVVNPTYQNYEITLDHRNQKEEIIRLIGVTTDVDGVKREGSISVPIDHTPATLKITYPVDNQRVCGVPEWHKTGKSTGDTLVNALRPVAEIEDAAGFDYLLEFQRGDEDIPNPSWQSVRGNLPSLRYPDATEKPFVEPLQLPYTDKEFLYSSPNGKRPYLTGKRIAGELGPIVDISGRVTARVKAYDWSGAEVCRQVSFYLDGAVEVGFATIERRRFSPGTGSSLNSVALSIDPLESLSVTVLVRRMTSLSSVDMSDSGIVRRLVTNLAVPAGPRELVWDGKNDAGQYVEDGHYTFYIRYEDGCGNLKIPDLGIATDPVYKNLVVEVDRTPPLLQLDKPLAGEVASAFLDIMGSVKDKNLQQWTLEYSLGSDPDSWNTLAANTTDVDLRKLATLNATLMQGLISLRLRAMDKVELSSEIKRDLRLRPSSQLIRKFGASPSTFSPNGDGLREVVNVVYDVFSPVMLDLRVKRGGVIVRRLLSQSPTVPGERAAVWDGLNDAFVATPDGEYTLEIRATSSANATDIQTEETTIVLDSTPPIFKLDTVLRPFMPGSEVFVGSVADQALIGYQVFVEGPLPTTKRVLFTEGSVVISKSELGTLTQLGLDDASYRIRVLADDDAGNTTNVQTLDFELDSKVPTVTFSNPAPGTFVSRSRPADISGLLDDRNLHSADLTIHGNSIYAPPVSSSSMAITFAFDGMKLPDGSYATQLIGTDKAGNVGVANGTINVDNTPPTAVILSPVANAAIGTKVPVIGTVNDANIESWKLELGSGAGDSLDSLTVIGRGADNASNEQLSQLVGLPPDGPATLRLTVEDKGGNISVFDVPLQIDATPPVAPMLSGIRDQRSDVRLNWTLTNDPTRIAGYFLYRNDTKVNALPLPDLAYLDAGLIDGRYLYTVTAVSRSGVESPRSNTVSIDVKATGPFAQINKPASHASVGGLVSIEGSAYAVANFRDYQVSVGSGAVPVAWTVLRTSSLPVQGDILARWSTQGLPEDAIFTIRLTATDIQGGVSIAESTVSIDNLPPAKPVGLQAVLSGSVDVNVSWSENSESDLVGYLLYRNGQLVNQIDPSDNSVKPYLLNATTYVDKARPDGTFVYTVVAVDKADNLSERSDPASVVVDNRAPHAVIVQPNDGANVDGVVYVRADSQDTDIASVRFEYKSGAASGWSVIAGASAKAPYSVNWNTQNLAIGSYQLRAVATDLTGHVDPAPKSIGVVRKNLQRPTTPSELMAKVDGGKVILSWSVSTSPDLLGYHVERTEPPRANTQGTVTPETFVRLTATPVASASYVDEDPVDATYQYHVLAVNSDHNESDPTPPAKAVVYTTQLKQPYTPVAQESSSLRGTSSNASDEVTVTHIPETGNPFVFSLKPDAQGQFGTDVLALTKGVNQVLAQQTDVLGNRSRAGRVRVARGDLPLAPESVTATASGDEYLVSWPPSTSLDLAGYVVKLDGSSNAETLFFESVKASSSAASFSNAERAIDAYTYTAWEPNVVDEHPSIVLHAAQKALVTELSVVWRAYGVPLNNFVIEAWDGFVWVPLKEEKDNTENSLQLVLNPPYYTDRVRISFAPRFDGISAGSISDVRGKFQPVVTGTSANVPALNGSHTVTVQTLSELGLLGAPISSSPSGIGDFTPPPLVQTGVEVTGAMVSVSWSESIAPDLAKYEVLRDGALIATVLGGDPRLYVDGPLVNGQYIYTVRPVDQAGNVGQLSNEALAMLDATLPSAPVQLTLDVPVGGGELRLRWLAPASGGTAAYYTVYRSTAANGPYDVLYKTHFGALSFADRSVNNGTRYYYVVRANDATGNQGEASNEVNGMAKDQQGPLAPAIFYPTDSQRPITVDQGSASLRVFSEPGARVTISRDGTPRGSMIALAEAGSTNVMGFIEALSSAPSGDLVAMVSRGVTTVRRLAPALDGSTSSTIVQTVHDLETWTLPVWSPDAKQLAITSESAPTQIIRVTDGHAAESVFSSPMNALAWHPDGARWVAVTNHWQDLVEIQIKTGVSRTIATASTGFYQIAISPDGQRIAVLDGEKPALLSLIDGSLIPIAARADVSTEPLVWAPDGQSLYFLGVDDSSSLRQIYRQSLGQVLPVAVTSHPKSVDHFSLSPFGTPVFAVEDRLQSIGEAGVDSPIVDLSKPSLGVKWANSGAIFIWDDDGVRSLLPPGMTIFPSTSLKVGQNLFVAQSTDRSGNLGAPSGAISVTYSAQQMERADLSVQAKDVVVLPQVPKVGAVTRITLVVNNLGAVTAPDAAIRMVAISPAGARVELLNSRSMAMVAGGSQVFRLDTTFNVGGEWQLSVAVDALNELDEASKDNNVLVLPLQVVEATSARSVSVGTAQATYQVGQTLSGSVQLFNGQSDTAGQLKISIEDAQGYVVATLPVQSLSSLPYGSGRTVDFSWTVPAVFDASYQVRAAWFNAGAMLAQATTAFSVQPTVKVNAKINSDSSAYALGTAARVVAQIDPTGTSPTISSAQTSIRVFNAGGVPVLETSDSVGLVSPAQLVKSLDTTGLALGAYTAELRIQFGTQEVAFASTMFEVVAAADPVAALSGELMMDAANAPYTGNISGTAILTNTGGMDLGSLQYEVDIIDPRSNAVLARTRKDVASLARGGQTQLTFSIPAAGMPIGTLWIQLRTSLVTKRSLLKDDLYPNLLKQREVALFELDPPKVVVNQPVAGAYLRAAQSVLAAATDLLSGVRLVEFQVNGGDWKSMTLADPVSSNYAGVLPPLSDGTHQLSVRASDESGNVSQAVNTPFVVDSVPPAIVISGIAETAYVNAVAATIVVTDLNLSIEHVRLNGAPYVSGSQISQAGAYVLEVDALDLAGNSASKAIRFSISQHAVDTTPPVIDIKTPLEGAFIRRVTNGLGATVVDAESAVAAAEFSIDGKAFAPMAFEANPSVANLYVASLDTLSDGPHSVVVRASDTQNNTGVSSARSFIVDNAAPVIVITGVAAGQYSVPVAPTIAVSDAALLASSVMLNGVAYQSGTVIDINGDYALTVSAVDMAGNTATTTLQFSLRLPAPDSTPPAVFIEQPLEASHIRTGTVLSISATDTGSGVAVVEQKLDGQSQWVGMSVSPTTGKYVLDVGSLPDGTHSALVRSSDNAGNISDIQERRFTVDNTAPSVVISGVAVGGQYPGLANAAIVVSDVNLGASSSMLNGSPYVSGTTISVPGLYTLIVAARDFAGNETIVSVKFEVKADNTNSPSVSISKPAINSVVKSGVLLEAMGQPFDNISRLEVSFGASSDYVGMQPRGLGVYVAPIPDVPDGSVTLNVRAVDILGVSHPEVTHVFTVDNTPPIIDQISVTSGGSYPTNHAITFQVADVHLANVVSTLDGAPFIPGQRLSHSGKHELLIIATDLAGNETRLTVVFMVKASPEAEPVPVPLWPLNRIVLTLMCLAMACIAVNVHRKNRKQ